tara:strand:+ start:8881 stop:10710 length:1830 start_codon:yes stop_codon:yes gene_type:complete
MKRILGISAFYHDSSASLIIGGKIIAAAQEERFTRIKHNANFPINAIKYCLEEAGLKIDELDSIVFYDKPLLKLERILQTYYAFAPKGLVSFLKVIPVWIKEKIFLKKLIYEGLKEIGPYKKKNIKLLFSEHHVSHAASAFYPSTFLKAAILTIDGVGEWATATIGIGEGNEIKLLKEMRFPHSLGLLYSSFTYYLGFEVNSGEYKLMGLAPYGNSESKEVSHYINLIKTKLIKIKDDGSIWLNQYYFNYAVGLRMVNDKQWSSLFGFHRRKSKDRLEQCHCNLAYAIQTVIEEIVIKMAVEAKNITGAEYLCIAGGVALNGVAIAKLLQKNIFKDIFVQPAAGDAGGSLGAALAVSCMYYKEARVFDSKKDQMMGSYLGPEYSNKEVLLMSRELKAVYTKYDDFSLLLKFIASKISEGNIIGWFQGRMEFGPRALGNRSILCDARNIENQRRLNLEIKNREEFRPFAPSVLSENMNDYFKLKSFSPYMSIVTTLKNESRHKLPSNYEELSLEEKLYCIRSDVHSITHVNFTARVQTVHCETNPKFWGLINEFKNQTGCSLLLNTSFNVKGEPIVCEPIDAYHCFIDTKLDYLVINDYVYSKNEQSQHC